jgi:hypothetical protein
LKEIEALGATDLDEDMVTDSDASDSEDRPDQTEQSPLTDATAIEEENDTTPEP